MCIYVLSWPEKTRAEILLDTELAGLQPKEEVPEVRKYMFMYTYTYIYAYICTDPCSLPPLL